MTSDGSQIMCHVIWYHVTSINHMSSHNILTHYIVVCSIRIPSCSIMHVLHYIIVILMYYIIIDHATSSYINSYTHILYIHIYTHRYTIT